MYHIVQAGKPGTRSLSPGGLRVFTKAGAKVEWRRPIDELGPHWRVVQEIHEAGDPVQRILSAPAPAEPAPETEVSIEAEVHPTEDDLVLLKMIVAEMPKEFPHTNETGGKERQSLYWSTTGECKVEKVKELVGKYLWESGPPLYPEWVSRKSLNKAQVDRLF